MHKKTATRTISLAPGSRFTLLDHFDADAPEVGLSPPSPLGLYDLVSNGRDWTLDWYDAKYYANSPILNPKGPAKGTKKVTRGQDNLEPVGMEMRAMTMVRLPIDPTGKFADYAMRCVANIAQKIQ